MKKVTPAPPYALLYPAMAELAYEHGYALALHGSLNRDLDVIAVPWVEEVSTPTVLVAEIVKWLRAVYAGDAWLVESDAEPEKKPHGRLAWQITLGGASYLDLSVLQYKG